MLAGKPRLLVSLKSILKNLAGTVPNRLDDLIGEAANVQQLSPEIVIGYVVIMDEAQDSRRRDMSGTWSDHFESNLRKIAIRKAPLWNQGDRPSKRAGATVSPRTWACNFSTCRRRDRLIAHGAPCPGARPVAKV